MDSKDDGQVPKPTEALRHAAAGEEPELVVHSQRPGEPDCSYYLKFGRCRYGSKCMFNHPPKHWAGQWQRHAIAAGEKQGQQAAEYPRRPGEPDCSHYVKFGSCKFEMNCRFNHPSRKQVYFPAGACKCNHHEIEEVRLNSLGLPLRPGTGLCSYYMQKGVCKFGSNCKFHHPNRSESEQEKLNADSEGSSQQNFYSILGDIIKPHPDLSPRHAPPPLDLPVPSYLLQQSSKGKEDESFSLTQPRQVYSCPEQSGYQQLADSHFEPAKQVRYTRDQLLQRRETQQLVDVSKDILELKQCIEMELHGEDYSWPNNDSNVHTLSYHRYDLADRRERHPRSTAKIPEVASEEKYWDNIDEEKESYGTSGKQEQFCKHDQLRCFEFDSKPQVGVLIGKAGETIRNLQTSSGAKVQITKDVDADSNALTRSVELVGTLASVDKAEQLIKSVIAEAEAGGSPALIATGFGSGQSGSEQFEMTVPDNTVGLIIGKGGETIKGLQTRSGARIQLIPQHPPEDVTLTERTVRVTGNKKQIEDAKDLIKQAMNQNFSKHANQSGGYGLQGSRPQGHGAASQWGPRSQSQPGYGYPPRGMPPPQNYNPPYGGYPQQGPPRGGMGWDQRQGPPPHPSYQGGGSDYYKQGSQPYDSQPPNYPPGPGKFNSYGQSQAPGYGQPPYPQHAPQQNYGHGYGDPRYNAPPPNQYYGQPPMAPQQGYPQQADPYARPPYSGPGQWAPRGPPAADGSYQAPPPASYGPPSQQPPAYGQTYGTATAPHGYAPQQSGQAPAPYGQNAPAAPGYPQQGGYAQYPQTQPAYGDQAAQANANYGYQGAPADPNYGSAYSQSGYGPPAPAAGQPDYASAPAAGQPAAYGQAGYTQPPTNPPSYDQSAAAPAQSGYAAPAANPQPAPAKGVSPQPAAGYAGGQWTA
ncbi:far upstream element-binding protein 1-like isoform X2 [Panicum virgatum]|uniref:far upstream element-binding protein 1-like isoform X2 n=1 Tax=Panicum virgatum TaxID=38727 RepID=UPI0019D666DE|nr:far upstream element-binding protein 1-like isoform X2 [Panicum virgatum]